jgi:hypothetical protein
MAVPKLWAEDGTLLEVSQSAVLRKHSRIRETGRSEIS